MSDDKTYEDGRYLHDYLIELLHSPGAKHPYVVRLWVWRPGLRDADDAPPAWHSSTGIKIIGEPYPHETSFKKLEKALKFYHQRQADADYTWLDKQLRRRTQENYERML